MKRRVACIFLCLFFYNALVLISLNLPAQEMLRPLHRGILLSGNFGELRATHFHSGIDIRTGGTEGWPVVSVKDGQLLRVSVSPVGYGKALYIGHKDGTTTVYGHLKEFIPAIRAIVRKLQYEQESFKIDEDFSPYGIFFRQGDTIAYSGNTGSSGGPHLHFEIRNTRTERIINPLLYYPIRDTKAPVARMLYLYTISENGLVRMYRQYPLKKEYEHRYSAGRITVPAGETGVGVYVTDFMNDSWNKLGVYRMELQVAGDTLFALQMDSCSFDQNVLINEVKDFDRYKKKETVYRCFGNYRHRFAGIRHRDKGLIRVAADSVVKGEIRMWDINGNRSRVVFELKGKAGAKADTEKVPVLRYDEAHLLELPGCRVVLDSFALFHTVEKTLRVEQDTLSGGNIYVLSGKDIPLFKKGRLFIAGRFSPQALICEVDGSGRRLPLETRHVPEGVEAEIGYLNRYTVAEDRRAPEITWLGRFADSTLRFRLKDDFAGIAAYRGEVNGQWCLFSYDPRTDLLQCSLSEPPFRRGQVNEVCIYAADRAGNRQKLTVKVKM